MTFPPMEKFRIRCKSVETLQVLSWLILKLELNRNNIVYFKQKDICNYLKKRPANVSRAITALAKAEILVKMNGGVMLSPYCVWAGALEERDKGYAIWYKNSNGDIKDECRSEYM